MVWVSKGMRARSVHGGMTQGRGSVARSCQSMYGEVREVSEGAEVRHVGPRRPGGAGEGWWTAVVGDGKKGDHALMLRREMKNLLGRQGHAAVWKGSRVWLENGARGWPEKGWGGWLGSAARC